MDMGAVRANRIARRGGTPRVGEVEYTRRPQGPFLDAVPQARSAAPWNAPFGRPVRSAMPVRWPTASSGARLCDRNETSGDHMPAVAHRAERLRFGPLLHVTPMYFNSGYSTLRQALKAVHPSSIENNH
jgi:hypothetical protein